LNLEKQVQEPGLRLHPPRNASAPFPPRGGKDLSRSQPGPVRGHSTAARPQGHRDHDCFLCRRRNGQRRPPLRADDPRDPARRAGNGWPLMPHLCLPVLDWPAPDRRAWDTAHRRGGLLEDDGLAAKWSPDTSMIIAGGYGRFLSFLSGIGDLHAFETPAERITRPRVDAYVGHL